MRLYGPSFDEKRVSFNSVQPKLFVLILVSQFLSIPVVFEYPL